MEKENISSDDLISPTEDFRRPPVFTSVTEEDEEENNERIPHESDHLAMSV